MKVTPQQVSIPLGTINTWTACCPVIRMNVSIPLGTINTVGALGAGIAGAVFQFH